LGLRLDTQSNQVRGSANPGRRSDTLLSPKLGLGWSPAPDTEINLSHSRGFRPGSAFRDARPMTRAYGTDLAAQTRLAAIARATETAEAEWLEVAEALEAASA